MGNKQNKTKNSWLCGLSTTKERQTRNYTHTHTHIHGGFPGGTSGKELATQCWRCKKHAFDPWVRKIPWRRAWQPTPVFSPGESRGQRNLAGSLQCHKELDTIELTERARMHTHTHTEVMERPPFCNSGLSLKGFPMDRGAWRAAVYSITKSWTRLN